MLLSALYELFNQSFEYLPGNKKSVHIGETNSLSLVNNKFKVIVLVDKNKIKNQDPPFLNRFEKHIFDTSILLSDELISLSEEIFDSLKEMFSIKGKKNVDLEQKFEKYFNFVRLEEIKGLVYIASKNYKNKNNKDYKNNKNNKDNNLQIIKVNKKEFGN